MSNTPRWASEDFWRKIAIWVTAGMFVVLIVLTLDSSASIQSGSSRVPA
jgi:nitric oxide reductase subunit C